MKKFDRIAFIGNHLPRRCGIATFTHDLHAVIANTRPEAQTSVVAMTDPGRVYDYPSTVGFEIHDDVVGDYTAAANFLHESRFEVVSLQHEYGIFGGDSGSHIDVLLGHIKAPIVTTLHTVLAEPTTSQREIMDKIIGHSCKLIVMAEKGREMLRRVHGVAPAMIEVIPHGIPDFPFAEPAVAKSKLGFSGRTVILTFGLLSPSKGIESVIDAMPNIIKACPNAVYVILGATHPNLVRQEGERYRERLITRVEALGIESHVVFFNQFVDQPTLLDFISMCDVYVTPYLHENQMTSGTLAYSFGLGKAVVSTPYWHAKELLAEGRGVLVPFGDSTAIGFEISALLTNDVRRHSIRKRAYAESRAMTWAQTAKRYLTIFDAARAPVRRPLAGPGVQGRASIEEIALPAIKLDHLLSLCDDTGLLQHAVHRIANRHHGYCLDDNARALLLSSTLAHTAAQLPEILTDRFAAFIQHAWNPDTGRFRNFMSFDRCWLEDAGSEDSHGRTLWALAASLASAPSSPRGRWAGALFSLGLVTVAQFQSPRAWAFTLLGLDLYCAQVASDTRAFDLRAGLAHRLLSLLRVSRAPGWCWFEDSLAYDNARLPQALIRAGMSIRDPDMVDEGLASLRWLMAIQKTPQGLFRPVGTDSYGIKRERPRPFDQQPLEASATISACIGAWQVTGESAWIRDARSAFAWFLGENDLHTPLVERETGSCLDGLHPDRANENCGAESVLSYLLGLVELRGFYAVEMNPDHEQRTAILSRIA